MSDYILCNGELYHHGVKGMKWGVRKKTYDTAVEKRKAYQQANKEYNKAFNKAYRKTLGSLSPIKKHRVASKNRWDEANEKVKVLDKARKEFKDAQKAIKAERKDLKREAKIERLTNKVNKLMKQKVSEVDKQTTNDIRAKIEQTYLDYLE